jgi:hypothetical protein
MLLIGCKFSLFCSSFGNCCLTLKGLIGDVNPIERSDYTSAQNPLHFMMISSSAWW